MLGAYARSCCPNNEKEAGMLMVAYEACYNSKAKVHGESSVKI